MSTLRQSNIYEHFKIPVLACFVNYFRINILQGVYVVAELTMMLFEKGSENNIRCRAINEWFRMDSYVSSTEKLLSEIGKVMPDVVLMDLDLYVRIDGIEISRVIRSRFDVSVMYVWDII